MFKAWLGLQVLDQFNRLVGSGNSHRVMGKKSMVVAVRDPSSYQIT